MHKKRRGESTHVGSGNIVNNTVVRVDKCGGCARIVDIGAYAGEHDSCEDHDDRDDQNHLDKGKRLLALQCLLHKTVLPKR